MSETILNLILNGNVITALATVAIVTLYWYLSAPKGIPPGPLGLPFVGYLPFLGRSPHEKFSELAKKYGPVFSMNIGNQLVVVLNNYEAIEAAFVKQAEIFSGRPPMHLTLAESDTYTLSWVDGKVWKEHRRFAQTVLKDYGFGKNSIEPLIMNEIQHFLAEINKLNGEPTDFSEPLFLSVSNNICILLFGKRFEYDDPWFQFAKQVSKEFVLVANQVAIFQFFPWLKKIPGIGKITHQERYVEYENKLKESLYIKISEGKKCYADGQRDSYMKAFIGEQKVREQKGQNNLFNDKAMQENMRNLMVAGTETTANTLIWSIVCMMLNPEVQKKVQKEIDDVIGMERTSCWKDRLRTPYTEATICEVQRFTTLIPLNVPHRNTQECEVLGYKIPKSSFIVSNLWAVHMDPELWKDPEVFRPERFLSENGELKKTDHLIPFSLGKRQCLGISLAKMELYLYFTSMLQKFTFKSPDGTTPSMEPRIGFNVAPKYFEARALLRINN